MACTSNAPRINLLPSAWGQNAWMVLYATAMGYPNKPTKEDKDAARNLVLSLRYLLPCEKCRVNFRAKMKGPLGHRLDDAVQCSDTFTRYIYDLEAEVASTTGAKLPSYDQTRRQIMSNTYVQRTKNPATMASPNAPTSTSTSISPAFWVTLPLAIVATAAITWGVTHMVTKRKSFLR